MPAKGEAAASEHRLVACPARVQLSGTLPKSLASMPLLSEVKVEDNDLIGTIPREIPLMPRLRRFQTEQNAMEGPIPVEFRWVDRQQWWGKGTSKQWRLRLAPGQALLISLLHVLCAHLD
jgi:hypothetical protein